MRENLSTILDGTMDGEEEEETCTRKAQVELRVIKETPSK